MSEALNNETFDIVVIGAGPAGIRAAITAANYQARVLLLDEQTLPGGQIYRQLGTVDTTLGAILGEDYLAGLALLDDLTEADLTRVHNACVWRVDPDGLVIFSVEGQAIRVNAKHLIIATGAMERPVPIPGWHLPGVMGVGAAQAALKGQGIIPESTVLAGSGPLLYLYACQLIRAGAPPLALLETQAMPDWRRAAPHIPAFLINTRLVSKGFSLLHEIRKANVPRYRAVHELSILGDGQAQGVKFRANGKTVSVESTTVLLHQGVVPNTQITRSLRINHFWNRRQKCFQPITDASGVTSNKSVSVAGDGAGILGADVAQASGELAALAALSQLGHVRESQSGQRIRSLKRQVKWARRSRAFLEALYQTPETMMVPGDNVMVCRCEQVTAAALRRAVRAGCLGPNQAKAFHRCGMGPCQGRYCGLTATTVIAAETGRSESDTGYYRIRAPLKPVTLHELGTLDDGSYESGH